MRHYRRIRRFPRLKAIRLALGPTSLVLGFALFIFGRQTGVSRCMDYAYVYGLAGLFLLAVRWILTWLKRRQKQAVRKRRGEQASMRSSQATL